MTSEVQRALALSSDKKLILEYDGTKLENAQFVPKIDATQPPKLKWTGVEQGPFLVVILDLDGPYPSAAFLSPILHWIQPGFNASTNGRLETSAPNLASWVLPNPPPFSGPHRYLVLLYKQPAAFNAEAFLKTTGGGGVPLYKRPRWSVEHFCKENSITDLLAASYFTSK